MSPAQRRYLLVVQGVGAAVFNFALNAGIAWLVFHGHDTVPLWGDQSIAGDTIATGIILPFLTTCIVTALTRRQLAGGHLAALGWTSASHPVLGWLPARTWLRALAFALVGVVVLSLPTVSVLAALGVSGMSLGHFVLFKATFAALASFLVTPWIALWAIGTAPVQAGPVRRGSAA